MNGADILIKSLKAQGVRHLVGMPGTQNIHIYEALRANGGIDSKLIRNEQSATLIANGYARASGEPGVALTVPGPGASNASTGILDASTDGVPVLLITGGTEVAHDGRDRNKCFHGLDQEAFFAPISRFYARPTTISQIPSAIEGAFQALRAPRPGPAVIELPVDIATAEGSAPIPARVGSLRPPTDEAALEKASEAISTMDAPVIIAGGNVIQAGACDELKHLAETLGAVVITTRSSKGVIPDNHPLCAGNTRTKLSRAAIEQADGLIAVGCRFTQLDTGSWSMDFPSNRVQLDPDPAELGREIAIDIGVAGDVRESMNRLAGMVSTKDRSSWTTELARLRAGFPKPPPLPVMSELRSALPDDAIFICDVTTIVYRALNELPITLPRTFHYPCHSVTLGFAVPAAIGAKIACPDRQVIAFSGDGGFQMMAYELATAAEHNIDVTFVVINDGSLCAIRGSQAKAFDGNTIDTDMRVPHLANLAQSMGARGIRVDGPERFGAVFRDVMGLGGPTVIEVMMVERRDELIRRIPWLYPD